MGTKEQPGKFDCHTAALPDEPTFTILARDPDFHRLVTEWANRRSYDIAAGVRPLSDQDKVDEAMRTAEQGILWRRLNNGKWRKLID